MKGRQRRDTTLAVEKNAGVDGDNDTVWGEVQLGTGGYGAHGSMVEVEADGEAIAGTMLVLLEAEPGRALE